MLKLYQSIEQDKLYNSFIEKQASSNNMNKIEQIRNQIIQGKRRRTVFNLKPLQKTFDFYNAQYDPTSTLDSESNITLFPIINTPPKSTHRKLTARCQTNESDKVQLRPFLREKRKGKCLSLSLWKRQTRIRNDTVQNVSSMMAKTYVPSVRINKVLQALTPQFSKTERGKSLQTKNVKLHSPKRQAKQKKSSPVKSPRRFKRFTRGRKTISPKKQMSPVRKFSISAWEIPCDSSQF